MSQRRRRALGNRLPEDDHARKVDRQVNRFDREKIDQLYRGCGDEPYDPVALLKMALYQILNGHPSPARWAKEAKVNLAMRWLGHGYTPSKRTWYRFRDRLASVIDELNVQLVQAAKAKGILVGKTGALDGTSRAACASRHRMVNRKTLEKRRQLLREIVVGIPVAKVPKWVPPTDWGRQDLLRRMEIAREELNKRIEINAAKPKNERKDEDKIQVSLTDPTAPLGRDKRKTFRPLYTIQTMTDVASGLIMSYMCEPSTTDAGMLTPMVDLTQQIIGGCLQIVLADGGYCSILDLLDMQKRDINLIAPPSASGTNPNKKARNGEIQIAREQFTYDSESDTYTCPEGHTLHYIDRETKLRAGGRPIFQYRYQCPKDVCAKCPLANSCLLGQGPRRIRRTEGEELMEAQREKMSRDESKTLYNRRGATAERVFGDAVENRNAARFHGRGPARVRCETGLLTLAQNILTLDNLEQRTLNPVKNTT